MKDREIEEMRGFRRSGLTFEQISDKTQYSINTVKKYCRGIKRGNSNGKSLMEVTSNPVLAFQNLDEMMQGAMATGVSLGSGFEAVHRSFTDKSLSKEDRMLLVMKGFSHLGGIGLGAVMTMEDLAKQREPPAAETVKSPDYENLVERMDELENENKVLVKLVKQYKDRDNEK